MNARDEDYEPGNEADLLLQEYTRGRAQFPLDVEEPADLLALAGVLAVLQVAREQRRTRLAIVELARVIVDELGSTPAT